MKKVIVLIFLLFICYAQKSNEISVINSQYNESVVRVLSGIEEKNGKILKLEEGSGVIISKDGDILTARHILYNNNDKLHSTVGILLPVNKFNPNLGTQKLIKMMVSFENKNLDIAVLTPMYEIGMDLPFVSLNKNPEKFVFTKANIISFPTSSLGIQTEETSSILSYNKNNNQISLASIPKQGSSGGGLFNSQGELLGVIIGYKNIHQPIISGETNLYMGDQLLSNIGIAISLTTISELFNQTENNPLFSKTITGSVIDLKSNNPIANATIGITKTKLENIEYDDLLGFTKTDSEGKFVLESNLTNDKYFLKVVSQGYQVVYDQVDLSKSEIELKVKLKEIENNWDRNLSVKIIDYRGFPVIGANFGLLKKDRNFSRNSTKDDYIVLGKSDKDGLIKIENLEIENGVYPVKVISGGYKTLKGYYKINSKNHSQTTLKLKLYPGIKQ